MTGNAAGRLQQLLLCDEVEDIRFDGTSVMLRRTDGRTLTERIVWESDDDLTDLIRRLGGKPDEAPGAPS